MLFGRVIDKWYKHCKLIKSDMEGDIGPYVVSVLQEMSLQLPFSFSRRFLYDESLNVCWASRWRWYTHSVWTHTLLKNMVGVVEGGRNLTLPHINILNWKNIQELLATLTFIYCIKKESCFKNSVKKTTSYASKSRAAANAKKERSAPKTTAVAAAASRIRKVNEF